MYKEFQLVSIIFIAVWVNANTAQIHSVYVLTSAIQDKVLNGAGEFGMYASLVGLAVVWC